VTLSPEQRILLDAQVDAVFLEHIPPLLPNNEPPLKTVQKNHARAFVGLAMAAASGACVQVAGQSVVDDHLDCGVDAVLFDSATQILYLLQAKTHKGEFKLEDALKFCSGISRILDQSFDEMNEHVRRRQDDLRSAYANCERVEVVLAEIGSGLSVQAKSTFRDFLETRRRADNRLCETIRHIDSRQILRFVQDGHAFPKVTREIFLSPWFQRDAQREAHFGLMPVSKLVDLYRDHGLALLDRNIRNSLGIKTDVNKAIIATLAERPADFELLNNGVTIIADGIVRRGPRNGEGQSLILSGMSIINGAQTVSSAFEFVSANPIADIAAAYVQVSIVNANGDNAFGAAITRARNHQNALGQTDFVALDPQQERLRRELAVLGYTYVFKPGAVDNQGAANRIDVETAARALALFSADPRTVVTLRQNPGRIQQVSTEIYGQLFHADLTAVRLLNAVTFAKVVNQKLNEQIQATAGAERTTYEQGGYAIGHMLAKRIRNEMAAGTRFDEVKVEQALSAPLDDLRNRVWLRIQPTVGQTAPMEHFRSAAYTLPLLEGIMVDWFGLTGQRALQEKNQRVGDPYNVLLHQYLAEQAPQIRGLS